MKVIGYKCFNKDLINHYGQKFEIGKIYIASGIIKFGTRGNGFHMCKNIEDCFRFFDTTKKDIEVCKVVGSGKIIEYSDEYNGYYDLYCVEKLQILNVLSREELINIGLSLNELRVERFVSTLSLFKEEISLFKEKYKKYIKVLDAISYYQENDKDVYNRK